MNSRVGGPVATRRAHLARVVPAVLALFVIVGLGVLPTEAATSPGLYVYPVVGAPYNIDAPIHVVTFYGAPYSLAIGLANGKVDGGLATPSAICHATPDCVAAVNGDYFDVSSAGPDPGDPVGGLIAGCDLLHTPEVSHQQADLDDASVSTQFTWSASLSAGTSSIAINDVNQELPVSYVGVHDPLRGTILYTSAYALATPTAAGRYTFEFKEMNTAQSPTSINASASLEYLGRTSRAARVVAGRVDVSATSSSALMSLAPGALVTLSVSSTMGCDDIGGHPIVLDNGVAGTVSPSDTYLNDRYPRTVVGWTTMGETVLLTVGGRDGASGATWSELLSLLRSLNVTTALDLDGGSSTSMFVDGRTVYSARATERPVSTALLVIRAPASATTTTTTTTTTTLP